MTFSRVRARRSMNSIPSLVLSWSLDPAQIAKGLYPIEQDLEKLSFPLSGSWSLKTTRNPFHIFLWSKVLVLPNDLSLVLGTSLVQCLRPQTDIHNVYQFPLSKPSKTTKPEWPTTFLNPHLPSIYAATAMTLTNLTLDLRFEFSSVWHPPGGIPKLV